MPMVCHSEEKCVASSRPYAVCSMEDAAGIATAGIPAHGLGTLIACQRLLRACLGGLAVIPTRFVIAASLCLATATIWPAEAVAQRRVAHVHPAHSAVVVGAGFYSPF